MPTLGPISKGPSPIAITTQLAPTKLLPYSYGEVNASSLNPLSGENKDMEGVDPVDERPLKKSANSFRNLWKFNTTNTQV